MSMDEGRAVRVGITMGDPAGIGPEVILKALTGMKTDGLEVVVYGARRVLELEEEFLIEGVEGYEPVLGAHSGIEVVEVGPQVEWSRTSVGRGDGWGARLQMAALRRAMEAGRDGEIDAIVTAPWNKALFDRIGEPVVGHTEVLADFYGVPEVVMMLAGPRLRVALVTTHMAIADVAASLTKEKIKTTVGITAKSLQERFGLVAPRIAVCGLNPHAGEEGHMGGEEIEIISPAIEELREEALAGDVELVGPLPADTLFAKFAGAGSPFDAVICMYHDQGLIPLKLLHFGQSANLTLGLPVIRTSVDHGTAYDIAGSGKADEGSMEYAIEMAISMARGRP